MVRKQKECDQNIREAMVAMENHERKRNSLFYGIERKRNEHIQEVICKTITCLDVPESRAQLWPSILSGLKMEMGKRENNGREM